MTSAEKTEKSDDADWQMNRSHIECMRYILHNKINCDVTFLVGEDEGSATEIPAHRIILASRSPVFLPMLSGEHFQCEKIIRVPDIDPDAFSTMLLYLYCDEVNLTTANVLPTMYASQKYLITALSLKCALFLKDKLCPDNVCALYEQSIIYDNAALMKVCEEFIARQTCEVSALPSFLNVPHSVLLKVLSCTKLSVSEVELWQTCLKWAGVQCKNQDLEKNPENKRQVLGGAIYYIRFSAMSMNEFSKEVIPCGILNTEEKCEIFESITTDLTVDRENQKYKFLHTPRENRICRMVCNKEVLITGFTVPYPFKALSENRITFRDKYNTSGPLQFSSKGNAVCLVKSYRIIPNITYDILLTKHTSNVVGNPPTPRLSQVVMQSLPHPDLQHHTKFTFTDVSADKVFLCIKYNRETDEQGMPCRFSGTVSL